MAQKGFVYILSNDSLPGKLKVGMSLKVPTERAKELHTTGVPTPFKVEYYAFFDDMAKAERTAHYKLKKYHHNKEFFSVDVPTAIQVIESIDIPFTKLFSNPENDKKAAEINLACHDKYIKEQEQLKRKEDQENAKKKREKEEKEKLNYINKLANEKSVRKKSREMKVSIPMFLVGIVMVLLAWNVYSEGWVFGLLFFGGGFLVIGGFGLLREQIKISSVLNMCPMCKTSGSVINTKLQSVYVCSSCNARFDYSAK